MGNIAVKTAFRKAMALTPRWVHRMLTEEKIRRLTKHLMSKEDRAQCLEHPECRGMILAEHMKKYPEHAARVERETEKVFSENPLFRDRPEAEKQQLAEDMRFCYFAYGFNVDEYIFFDLSGRNSTHAKRQELVSDLERMCFRFSANDFTESRLSNKTTMYELLKDFYKRDAAAVNSQSDYERYLRFIQAHSRFVEKAAVSSRGQGVRLVESPISSGGGKSYFDDLLKRKPVLLEELIVQSDDMAQFNRDSVNTVRMSTFYTREGIVVPFAVIRVGRKGSFIDNCATGGICAAIDVKTGQICSDGGDELGGRYKAHPDSGQTFFGFALPDWEQAKQLCREAAAIAPNLKYLSWDIAHTRDRGWAVIEVNTSGQFLWQGGTLTGIRSELRALMENMDLLTSYKL